MGTFAQRGLAASSLCPCGSPVPITRDAAFSCPLFILDKILGSLRMIPQELLVRRSPGYLPAVVQLDAVLDPGGLALCSSVSHSPRGLRPFEKDRHAPKIRLFSGLCVRFRATFPSPRCSRLSFFLACAFSHYATGRLTNLTQEGLGTVRPLPSQQATIARSPQTMGF